MKKEKTFSIITISYNKENEIERTIQSVINQSCKDFEYIVIDGKSTDDTLKVLTKYNLNIDKIVSEKDDGIYDAMNKGLSFANNNYVIYMNAGDEFDNNNVLRELKKYTSKNIDYIYSKGKIFYNDRYRINKTKIDLKSLRQGEMPCHQCLLVKKEVLYKIGAFNTSYKIAGDFDLCCKLFQNEFKGLYLDIFIAKFYKGGLSGNYEKGFQEIAKIVGKYFGKRYENIYRLKKLIIETNRRKLFKILKLDKLSRKLLLLFSAKKG